MIPEPMHHLPQIMQHNVRCQIFGSCQKLTQYNNYIYKHFLLHVYIHTKIYHIELQSLASSS